ncbi:MAG TPA: protein-methionine-sulfoxide reductase catalytic subunit MsrP [Anaerolineaceae bacterium]
MKTRKFDAVPIASSEITPEALYYSRRKFIRAASLAAAAAALSACLPTPSPAPTEAPSSAGSMPTPSSPDVPPDTLNTYEEITTYNNFYEFTTSKEGVARLAKDFRTAPWQVEVSGLVHKPQTFGIEDLLKKFQVEERIYRLRCVEAWSMVIPWNGFRLSELLKAVEPMTSAKYVRFETIFDPSSMPGQKSSFYPWPYSEGLRLDEAYHDLTILSTGLYGKTLLPQNGAPLRLVVPWKYGFKSIKSIVKIELVPDEPETLWSTIAPNEYGFYANVNPNVRHPRWSQATERRIGETNRRKTLLFNGYAGEVAGLYANMDLKTHY